MKLSFTVLMALGALYSESLQAQNIPVTIKGDTVLVQMQQGDGFGRDGFSSSTIGSKDAYINEEEYQTYPKMKNIPAGLTGVKEFFYPLDRFQFFFQSFKAGKISQAGFLKQAKGWEWNLADTAALSKNNLPYFINVAVGKNKNNDDVVVVDANNNGDYADDTVAFLKSGYSRESELVGNAVQVSTTYITDNQSFERKVPVFVYRSPNSSKETLTFVFPEHFYQKFTFEGIPYKMYLSTGFTRRPYIAVLPDGDDQKGNLDRVYENQYVKINNADFKVIKINKPAAQIILVGKASTGFNAKPKINSEISRTDADSGIVSFSKGYLAPPIDGLNINRNFTKYNDVSLGKLKGKYVYVDFWSTYCAPCIAEMPYLVKAYQKLPRDKFDIVGVFDERDAKITQKLMKNNGVAWPNVLQHAKTSNIVGYGPIFAYPTTVLIGPDGKIISIGLRGPQLMGKLDELMHANVSL